MTIIFLGIAIGISFVTLVTLTIATALMLMILNRSGKSKIFNELQLSLEAQYELN